jgi:L-alanine-DL-glutamate epimerase-like enolase superfamily enzyme
MMTEKIPIENLQVSTYKIPTHSPESDGTLKWDATIMVVVEIQAGNKYGIGYTYADLSVAALIQEKLADLVIGEDALSVLKPWSTMWHEIRNLGGPGISSMAISAIDVAQWDLKAKLLDVSLAKLLGPIRHSIPIYGSGGFTSYNKEELRNQFENWKEQGITCFKMKVGRDPSIDLTRVRQAREIIGSNAELFVDANGGYTRKQALYFAQAFRDLGVTWFEEPVSSDDLDGLRLIRDRAPAGMEIAAGEYGYDTFYFRRMLEAGAVDVLQADASRCKGITGFLQVGALCQAFSLALSAHTAPQLHIPACCATYSFRNLEYFFDHERIERMFFDGVAEVKEGTLSPDFSKPGLGIELKRQDAERYKL